MQKMPLMTDSLTHVISYSRFLEYQERRRAVVAELALRDQPQPIEADVLPAATEAVTPLAPTPAVTR
jgi:hypothetical protein